MFAVVAVVLGFFSVGAFALASAARADGCPRVSTDWISVGSFVLFALAFWYATPAITGVF